MQPLEAAPETKESQLAAHMRRKSKLLSQLTHRRSYRSPSGVIPRAECGDCGIATCACRCRGDAPSGEVVQP